MSGQEQITQLLQAAAEGDREANNELFTTVYQELRKIARAHRNRWQGNPTLNTTALIGEVYLKLAKNDLSTYESRTHFYATASKAMPAGEPDAIPRRIRTELPLARRDYTGRAR